MRRRIKAVAIGVATLALAVGGLAGCSSKGGDVEACEAFNETMSDEAALESAEGTDQVVEGTNRAADLAKSDQLAGDLRAFGEGFASLMTDEDSDGSEFFDSMIHFKQIVDTCEAAGAEIPDLKNVASEMGLDELSIEDLEEMRDSAGLFDEEFEEDSLEGEEVDHDGDDAEVVDFDSQNLDYDFDAIEDELVEAEDPGIAGPYMGCVMGDLGECDLLYERAPAGSELAKLAGDCGGFKMGMGGRCTE